MTFLCGIHPKVQNKTANWAIRIVLALLGLAIVEVIGGIQWHFVGGSMSLSAIAIYSLIAFVPKDIVITILALFIAVAVRRAIEYAGAR